MRRGNSEVAEIKDSLIRIYNKGIPGDIPQDYLFKEIDTEQEKINAIQTDISGYPFPEI